MTDWRSCLRSDPMPWLLENACAPIRYRLLTELMDRGREDADVQALRQEIMGYLPALQLQRKQRKDGSWGGKLHAGDPRRLEPSMENLLYKLFEYGWRRETRPVQVASKTLRTLLGSKKDLPLFEFARTIKADDKRERYYRWFVRILALGLLCRAGYLDERIRAAVLELLERAAAFVDSPVSRDPAEEIGASHPLIKGEAWRDGYPFIPDLYMLRVFAFSPWLLQGEIAKVRLKKIFDYVLSPTYQELAPSLGLVRTERGVFVKDHGIKLTSIEQYQKKGNLDELLVYLDLLARLGLINRYPLLMAQLEWLQSQQGKDGRWNLSTKLLSDSSRWTQLLRIERDWRSPTRKEADLTFRILLILRHQWERQIRMLDRRDDAYPL
jgi:hypothetical protein